LQGEKDTVTSVRLHESLNNCSYYRIFAKFQRGIRHMMYSSVCKFPAFDVIKQLQCKAAQAALYSPDLNPALPILIKVSDTQHISYSCRTTHVSYCVLSFFGNRCLFKTSTCCAHQRLIQQSRALHTASPQAVLNKITQQIPLLEQQASSKSHCTPYQFPLNLGGACRRKGGNRYE